MAKLMHVTAFCANSPGFQCINWGYGMIKWLQPMDFYAFDSPSMHKLQDGLAKSPLNLRHGNNFEGSSTFSYRHTLFFMYIRPYESCTNWIYCMESISYMPSFSYLRLFWHLLNSHTTIMRSISIIMVITVVSSILLWQSLANCYQSNHIKLFVYSDYPLVINSSVV